MNWRSLSIVPVVACFACLSHSCVKDDREKVEEYVKVGDPVPSFSVILSDPATGGANRRSFTSSDFTGKSSLIVLFTAECPNCQALLPHVDQAWQDINGDAVCQIIAIARESPKTAVDELWDAAGMSMPYYLDPDRSAYNRFASRDVPRLYHVNELGIVDWMQSGETGITKDVLLSILGSHNRQ